MRRYILMIILVAIGFVASAQQEQFVSLEIDRIAVKNGQGFNYQWEWEEYEAQKWGLTQRHRQYPYDDGTGRTRYLDHTWWSWQDERITKTTLTDGSVKSSSQSSFINVSVNLHPQWLILSVKNLTNYYLVLDLSSMGHVTISPPEPNMKNRRYDVSLSMGSLMNYYGSQYHTVVLPPYAEIDVPYYNQMWKSGRLVSNNGNFSMSGEDRNLISKEVENGARVDLNLSIGIFRADPLVRNKAFMQNEEDHYFRYEIPSEHYHKYQGAYFKIGSAYYIAEDYASLFDGPDMRIQEQIICKYTRTNRELPTKQNELGFLQFAGNVQSSTETHFVPKSDNSMIRKEDEPKHHLGQTISQVRSIAPGLKYVSSSNGKSEYEYDDIQYTFKNGVLVCEYTEIEGGNGFGLTAYKEFVNKFKKTNYSNISESNNSTTFYYSNFSISFLYWAASDSFSICYRSFDY